MSRGLEAGLRADLELASRRRQDDLVLRARELYRLGFERISPSQMAAVGELLRQAGDLEAAGAAIERWMENALRKLEARRERTGKVQSWLLPAGGEDCLGRVLVAWLTEGRFLGAEPPAGLDGLAALRRFWERFHGFYRYRKEMGHDLPLEPTSETTS